MLNLVVMFAVAVLPPNHSGAGLQPAPVIAEVSREAVSRGDDAARRLAAEPLEVAPTYETLVSQKKRDRLQAFGALPSSMKSAIWTHQFLIALAQHPEFTEEQRAVLYDAIALFTPRLFEISNPSPEWSSGVDQPLQKLTLRAKAAFGPLASKLFAQLGPLTPAAGQVGATDPSVPPGESPKTLRSQTLHPSPKDDLPLCECSTTSDYCAFEHGSDWSCVGGGSTGV